MHDGDGDRGRVSITRTDSTIRVRDEIESATVDVVADRESSLVSATTALFPVPVDAAVRTTAKRLSIPQAYCTAAWDDRGEQVGGIHDESVSLPSGTYVLSLTGATMVYVRVEGTPVEYEYAFENERDRAATIEFPEPVSVVIGARSLHTRPEATVTIPDDAGALLDVLPYLASSIHECTSERTWPTIRGHPPELRVGEHLDVPFGLSKPETGVTISVPERFPDAYRIAPLSFYLGATVEAGDEAAIHLENGYTHPLGESGSELEASVADVLGRCFLLDTLVRTAGTVSHDPSAYGELAGELSFYPPNLYGESLSTQLVEYLEVSSEVVERHLPRWPLSAVVRPTSADAPLLPSILHRLGRVRVTDTPTSSTRDRPDAESVNGSGTRTGSPDRAIGNLDADPLVRAYSHGSDGPLLCPAAFENALSYAAPSPDAARLTFATDDPDRAAWFRDRFDRHERFRGPVSVLESPTVEEFERTLSEPAALFFCELPWSEGVLACADGSIDLRAVDGVDAGAIVLAGRDDALSEAARALVRAGALGVVGATDRSAAAVNSFASLLALSYPLVECARLSGLADRRSPRVIGHPLACPVSAGGSVKNYYRIDSVGLDEHEFRYVTSFPDDHRLGSVARTCDDRESSLSGIQQLLSDRVVLFGRTLRAPGTASTDELVDLLCPADPVLLNGRPLTIDRTVTAEDVRESARERLRHVSEPDTR
ncbi:hypothetical protein [Halovivax gelatinilyticus]|uniref:hypothetical protein n=1 Tax=Halovivax gelatinilyticus TaxID=2961597 RepID=UPI0020CA66E9|nr:hypothetical protein [Halovivax gelatinilyticus]